MQAPGSLRSSIRSGKLAQLHTCCKLAHAPGRKEGGSGEGRGGRDGRTGWAAHLLGCFGRKPTFAVLLLTPIPPQLPVRCLQARLLEGQLSTAGSPCSHPCAHRHMATMSLVTGIVCCSRVQGRHVQARPMFLYTKQARPEDRKLSEEGGVILAALRPLLLLVPAGVGAWGRGRSLRRRGRRG